MKRLLIVGLALVAAASAPVTTEAARDIVHAATASSVAVPSQQPDGVVTHAAAPEFSTASLEHRSARPAPARGAVSAVDGDTLAKNAFEVGGFSLVPLLLVPFLIGMAVPANVTQGLSDPPVHGDELRQQINNLVASFRLLTAKLDADAGVTDANYNALITDDAVATAPRKINR